MFSVFGRILLENILPAFVVIGVGVLADRALHIDKRGLSRLAIYLLAPCLVFDAISNSVVEGNQFWRLVAHLVLVTIAMCCASILVAKLLRWSSKQLNALVLSTAFLNSGNLGLSVVFFSFGEVGLEYATVFFVMSNLMCNSLAVWFAARGAHEGNGWRALGQAARLPGAYAFLLAMIVRWTGLAVPPLVAKPVGLLGQASVPVMLLLLGIQLSQTKMTARYGEVAVGVVLRLVVGTLVALGAAPIVGLTGLPRSVAVLQGSMPTAVTSSLLAITFDADADYVTSVVFVTTLLSSISLSLLLSFLL
ncbi:MAG: AEC family transporter [Anaerolineae bacterium]|nr:AEC family transporter [Anaerolineae bacterium]